MARAAKANSTKFISMFVSPPGDSGGGFALGNNTANLDLQKLSTVMRCNIVIIRCVDAGIGVEAGAGTCIYRPHIINSGGSGKTVMNHALQQTAPGAVSIFVVACAAESASASAAAGEAAQPSQLLYAGLPNRSVKRAASLPPPATPWSVIVKFVSVHGFSFTEPAPSPKTIVFNDVASATIGSVVAACAPSLLPWGCEVLAIEKQGVSLELSVPLRSAVPIMRSTLMAHCRKLQASALVAVSPQSGSRSRPGAAAAAAAAASAAAAATSDVSAAGASAGVSAFASPMPKSSSSAKQHRGATAAAALHVVDDSASESFNAGTAQQPVACLAMRTAVVQAYCAQRAMSAQLKAVETLQKAISAATQQLTTRAAAATTTSVEAAPTSTALVVMPQTAPPVKQRGSERAAAAANKRKASELAAAASVVEVTDGVEEEFGGEEGELYEEMGGGAAGGSMQLNHLLLNSSLLGNTRATGLSLAQLALHQQLQEQQLHAAAAARQSSSSSPAALQNQSHRLAFMQQQLQADRIAAVAAEQQHHQLIMQQQAARSAGAGRGSSTPFPATTYGLGGVVLKRR